MHIFVLYFVIRILYFVFRFVFEEAPASRRRGSLSPLGGMPLRRTQVANTDGRTNTPNGAHLLSNNALWVSIALRISKITKSKGPEAVWER